MFTEKVDWYEIWDADKKSMLETMVRNMASDLENGYSYFGECIQRQMREIEAYKARYNAEIEKLAMMDNWSKVKRWCYLDMKRRGAID